MQHRKLQTISLKNHPSLNERWVQEIIAADPSILGLGDLILKDKERIQPTNGRLDILLQEPEAPTRYEVEIQLGATDEKHIIRTIEYWDIERKRYPQYEHCAVIVAEEITSRFYNVISLFNGSIPLIAIQMSAIQLPNNEVGLHFTKVLDVMSPGLVDEDEEVSAPTDRAYWETGKGTTGTVRMVDEILLLAREVSGQPKLQLKYNKHYVGLTLDGAALNFIECRPNKSATNLAIKLPQTEETTKFIEDQGLDLIRYERSFSCYFIRMRADDITKHKPALIELIKRAYTRRVG
jgi:hypothetical protein